jgi:elongation factor G
MEEYFLNEQDPSNAELRHALRRATLAHQVLPVLAGAALKGKGVEPLMDAIADLLPSPLDRMPPALNKLEFVPVEAAKHHKKKKRQHAENHQCDKNNSADTSSKPKIALGHPLHPSLLALAFKVVHMKGRGGSGDGRVVFARVYSGVLRDRELVQVVKPPAPGESPALPRSERVCGMLELSGGRFDNFEHGVCRSGDVCALVGLKSVVTGDTIMMIPDGAKQNMKAPKNSVCLAGVASPKPVLTVRLETESTEQQSRLTEALTLLAVEDPSLLVEESPRGTLLSGLGELHIEVTLDRIYREFGLQVRQGAPVVAYRETVNGAIETDGLVRSERSVGGAKMHASLHLLLEKNNKEGCLESSASVMVSDPVVELSEKVRKFLQVSETLSTHDLMFESELVHALVQGCQGALKRGPVGSHAMTNVTCHVLDLDADGGLPGLQALPGSLRAAAVSAISSTLKENKSMCVALEPCMSIEISVPDDMVGMILSDLTGRRGLVNEVVIGGDDNHKHAVVRGNALIRGEVPLVEIIGYANSLRSITAGQGSFTAEYSGYSRCS